MTAPVFHKPNNVIYKNRVFVRPKGVSGTHDPADSTDVQARKLTQQGVYRRLRVKAKGFRIS